MRIARHWHISLLGFVAHVLHAAATSARSSSGLKRRQHVSEAVLSTGGTDEATDYSSAGLRVQRLAGLNTVLNVITDSNRHRAAKLGKYNNGPVGTSVDPPAMTSEFGAPSFFQMGSVSEAEGEAEEQRAQPNVPGISVGNTEATQMDDVKDLPSSSEGNKETIQKDVAKAFPGTTTGHPAVEAKPLAGRASGGIMMRSEKAVQKPSVPPQVAHATHGDGISTLSRVKDLSDRSIVSPVMPEQVTPDVNSNTFLGWMKDMVAVGERGATANDLVAVDSLGGSETEANYSAETEGMWLLTCIGGLILFSCAMVCMMKLFFNTGLHAGFCWAARRGEPTTFAHESDSCKDVDASMPETAVVPAFQAVVNSALAAEVGVEGVESLLSAVAGLPAERTSKSQSDVAATGSSSSGVHGSLRAHVTIIQPCTEKVLRKLDAQGGGYDCAIARPLSFCQVVRLQATVLEPDVSRDMLTPLALQMSVLYQATVSWRLHAGMPPVPVAHSAKSSSFQVASCTGLRVSVEGGSVTLFDTVAGYYTYTGAFANAPGHLQDYVLAHRNVGPGERWQNSSALWADAIPLEFQECSLLVGSKVTLVGELSRGAGGDLVLSPTYHELPELGGAPRVLVSDDHQLFE